MDRNVTQTLIPIQINTHFHTYVRTVESLSSVLLSSAIKVFDE